MKKILIFFCFCFLAHCAIAQNIPQPLILSDVYPSSLFDSNYSNELFRNRFVKVQVGSDTVYYFVDLYGRRALMPQGVSGGGGSVVANAPLSGNGTIGTPLKLANGARNTDFLCYDSLAQAWINCRTAYNTNLSTTAGATGLFQVTDGKQTLTIPKSSIAPVQQVTGSAEIQVVNLGSSNYGFNLEPQGATTGQVLTYNGTRYAPATPSTALPSLADGKMWVGNSSNIATAVTPSKDALVSNTGAVTVRGASQYWGITNFYTYTIAGNRNDLFVNGSRAVLAPTVAANITGLSTALNAGKIVTLKNENNLNSFPITFINQSTSSLDTNRFNIGSDFVLNPGKTVTFLHDSGRWIFYAQGQSTLIDTFSYSGSTLSLSLQNDGVPAKTVTISGGGGSVTGGNEGVSLSGANIQLGNTVGGTSAQLTANREILLNKNSLLLKNSTTTRDFVKIEGGSIHINTDTSTSSVPLGDTLLWFKPPATNAYVNSPFVTGVGDDYSQVTGGGAPYPNRVWWHGPNLNGSGAAYNTSGVAMGDVWETSWVSGGSPVTEWHTMLKIPSKDAIRLSSYTIFHPNADYPAASFGMDFYRCTNNFSLRGVKNNAGATYTYNDYMAAAWDPTLERGSFSYFTHRDVASGNLRGFKYDGSSDVTNDYLNFSGIGGGSSKVLTYSNFRYVDFTGGNYIDVANKTLGTTTIKNTANANGLNLLSPANVWGDAGAARLNFRYSTPSTNYCYIDMDAGTNEFKFFAQNNFFPTFYSNNLERMRINTGGEMLIGTTTDGGAYPLQVNGAVLGTNYDASGTGANKVPNGTTAQRPTAAVGIFRYNSTNSRFEGIKTGTTWDDFLMRSDVPSGTFNADVLSWNPSTSTYVSAPANRSTFVGPGATVTPAESVTEIFAADATASTVNLNYTPGANFNDPYTTTRWIYNTGAGVCTVQTNQSWQFRSMAAVDSTTFTLTAGQAAKIIWNSTLNRWFYKIM